MFLLLFCSLLTVFLCLFNTSKRQWEQQQLATHDHNHPRPPQRYHLVSTRQRQRATTTNHTPDDDEIDRDTQRRRNGSRCVSSLRHTTTNTTPDTPNEWGPRCVSGPWFSLLLYGLETQIETHLRLEPVVCFIIFYYLSYTVLSFSYVVNRLCNTRLFPPWVNVNTMFNIVFFY